MTLATKKRRYWTCPKCSHRNEHRTSSRKCVNCAELTKPKRRVPKHAEVLRDLSYTEAARLSQLIHGGELGACGYCQRPKPEGRNHDRDHDHRTGAFRGLACFTCNRERLRGHTLETMRAGVAFLERAEAYR